MDYSYAIIRLLEGMEPTNIFYRAFNRYLEIRLLDIEYFEAERSLIDAVEDFIDILARR